ncbi:fimbrillin family protein [Parabacteroides sp.]|uniref:BF2992 family fimbrillin-A clan protein n=1 Tax=Parabacteroides sp. TaxID=1869337 RepID=UPI0030802C1D
MKRYLICLLVGLLTGCTSGSVEEMPEKAQLVAISFGKPDLGIPVILTRSDEAVMPEPTPLPEGATIRVCGYLLGNVGEQTMPAAFSAAAATFESTYEVLADGSLSPCLVDDAGKKIAGEAEKTVVRSGIYDFYAVSPARSLQKGNGGSYQITDIPHKEDVMTSSARSVTVSESSRQVRLGTFHRKCALVVFNVAPSKENVLPFSRLYATRLKISKISSSGAVLIAGEDTGIPATGGVAGETGEVVFETGEFEPVEEGADPDNSGLNKTKGVLLPKTAEPFEVEIDVQRDEKTATLKATVEKSIFFDEGQRYVFTLEVKNNESRLQMRVLAWNTVPFTDAHVGAPDQPYPDPDINQGVGTELTVARWKEIIWSGNGEAGGGA